MQAKALPWRSILSNLSIDENNEMMMQTDYSFSRLAWGCRRGMLELDVLLGRFLEDAYPTFSLEDKHRFATLLTYPDPILYDWLMGNQPVSSAEMIELVDRIRRAYPR
jgi:antitoxin CptB